MTNPNVNFPLEHNNEMPSEFHKLSELSRFRKKLLRFFSAETEHSGYAPIIKGFILCNK